MHHQIHARHFIIKGLVQGVGFRPAVYRLAHEFGLKGWVKNTNEGVLIHTEGTADRIEEFIGELENRPPKASTIYTIDEKSAEIESMYDFSIRESNSSSDDITQVSPDIAVCEECLEDMKSQPHRIDYAFTNCTNCGPRFTIIKNLPYDRQKTTMSSFEMCDTCHAEYETVNNRRFHAQPVACNKCGPTYTLHFNGKQINDIQEILDESAGLIEKEKVIAVKGLGGFHLLCDAKSEKAVKKLREIKFRDNKPFAVMTKNPEAAKQYVQLSDTEKQTLTSWRRPIILLKQKEQLAEGINPGMKNLGIMLPYMPFHHLLFKHLKTDVVVLTSGNISDEPILINNKAALDAFENSVDAVITYDREIHNRADDSVVFSANEQIRVIRRSRGYVPEPVRLSFSVDGILGVGAELSHCFALGKGKQVLMSQHIGDLKDPKTYAFFEESVTRLQELFRMKPNAVACDLHPDYLSTRFARELQLPVVEVQHHHAHIAAAIAEFNLHEPVLGVCWDGTGLGTDGSIWGGEFMYTDLTSFERFSHFEYIPLPGGDKAALEPWRTALSYLYQIMGKDFLNLNIPMVQFLKLKGGTDLILQAIDQEINTPLTSAAGRLFDAMASLTNICHFNSFHAEAPMKLEAVLDESVNEEYPWSYSKPISFELLIQAVGKDLHDGVPVPVISAKFHNTLISVIDTVIREMNQKYGSRMVVLTGGVFQNKYLLEGTEKRLSGDFEVFSPQQIPTNDAGIALGQLVVAANKLNLKS